MPSKYTRKRKHDLDEDTSGNVGNDVGKHKSDRSPSKKSKQREEKSGGNEESMSIEETNRVRAELGLAPLEIEAPTEDSEPVFVDGGVVFKEDGVELVHKAATNLQEDKNAAKLREKLETQKNKTRIYNKVLKTAKGLGDSDSEEESVDDFVEKMRIKAQKKAQDFDSLDQEAEQEAVAQQKKANEMQMKRFRADRKKKEDALTAGLLVGHSKDAFMDGTETILVLQDKNVLDEDTDEILINPNLDDNERHKKNVEKRKQKSNYTPYEEETFDEFGVVKKRSILAKYDEELDGEAKRETFRLDQSGDYGLDREEQEMEMKRKLMMANKRFETLETPKFIPAREFYTEEEMLTFRKPKSKKDKTRKTRTLKASDLAVVEEESTDEKAAKAKRLAARRQQIGNQMETELPTNGSSTEERVKKSKKEMEEGEVDDSEAPIIAPTTQKWKQGTGASVDLSRIRSFANKVETNNDEESDEEEEDLIQGVNLNGIFVEDEAEDELHGLLERTRKLQQSKAREEGDEASYVRKMLSSHGPIKSEANDSDSEEEFKPNFDEGIIIDSTSEQYKMIGEIPTFGLAGNRNDDVDYSELLAEHKRIAEEQIKEEQHKNVHSDEEESDNESFSEVETNQLKRRNGNDSDMEIDEEEDDKKPMWKTIGDDEPTSSKHASDSKSVRSYRKSRSKHDEDKEMSGSGYKNALGDEIDVTKGVGAMLRLAGEKGYLENKNRGNSGGDLKHLESKRFSRVDQGRMDIEDKYIRKLERMGTTGSGPIRSFSEKSDYKPNVEITYTDTRGRIIEKKEAFRELSHKFHGKGPGKKQIEKRQAQVNKKDRMKQMNSADTPLGTLQKQIKKNEQTQSPFIILSNRSGAGTQLQKD